MARTFEQIVEEKVAAFVASFEQAKADFIASIDVASELDAEISRLEQSVADTAASLASKQGELDAARANKQAYLDSQAQG